MEIKYEPSGWGLVDAMHLSSDWDLIEFAEREMMRLDGHNRNRVHEFLHAAKKNRLLRRDVDEG